MLRHLLIVLGLLAGPLCAPALAGPEDRTHEVTTKAEIDAEDTNGFVRGFIADWATLGTTDADRTQFRLFVSPDDLHHEGDGDRSTGSTEEWSVELYAQACDRRKAYPLAAPSFHNSRTYGPSMNLFVAPAVLDRARDGCLYVVHSGGTPTRHAIEAGYSGRHVVARVPIASVLR